METISSWWGLFVLFLCSVLFVCVCFVLSNGIHVLVKAFAPAGALSCMDSTAQ